MKRIELLAPAKNIESAVAAVDYGADALYIGGAKFGARHAAGNSVEDIARVVEYAHQYGVKVHSTLNTLLFDNELDAARDQALELISTGIDALIVQDMALTRMQLPIELHASTQMCNFTAEGVKFLEECGFARVVLERALSLEQIINIRKATNIELEAFVHGAICVSHSGRCFLSRSISSRSGNRGECSQPCRQTYDLIDEAGKKIISNKHLLSVKDLNLTSQLGAMIDAGVCSFKVEGRLKDIGYTKNIVAHYRTALDKALSQRPSYERSSIGNSQFDFTPNPSKSFTRGESEYLFSGQSNNLASFDTPKAVGERVGIIESVRADKLYIKGMSQLKAGDGVCFVTDQGLVGTNINVATSEWIVPTRMDGATKGAVLYRNFDKAFNDLLERSRTRRTIDVEANVQITPTQITVSYCDIEKNSVSVTRSGNFEAAQNTEKMENVFNTQLSKSGDTIFKVVNVNIEGDILFAPSSLLADIRREALEELRKLRIAKVAPHKHFSENREARYPISALTAENNVTNHLAEEFYRDHGVESITKGWDISENLNGARVMQSSYCIRREIGECLKQGSKLRSELYIQRGVSRYRLEFDCKNCQMNIYTI